MGGVLKLVDYRKKVRKGIRDEPFAKLSDEQINEYLNMGIEKAIEHIVDTTDKRVRNEILRKTLG